MANSTTTTVPASRPSARQGLYWNSTFLALLLILPLVAPRYWIYFACIFGINVIATHGLNIMMGYTGLLSLGHAAFLGVGAYTTALLQIHLGLPVYITLPLAGLAAAVIGIGFGLPSLRIRGLYLVIATLAAQFILQFVFVHWESVTNGDVGLTVAPPEVLGMALNTEGRIYYLILFVAVCATLFAVNVIKSRVGRAFIAIRERDLTAEVLGVEIVWYKLVSFALGSFYAGVAGGLLVYFNHTVNPEQFGLMQSVFFLSAVIIGGMGSTLGAILGALFMTLMPEALSQVVLSTGDLFSIDTASFLVPLRETIFGFLMVAFLIFEPRGIAHIWARIRQNYLRRNTAQ
ncbi:amino acid/amide ABC transporter membrane protein 2, HAAT family [Hoeflea sp. IMCC20628]|uniref:branched-chain amino acid ABC transporter permease n=1 Tax=Hoeflea sp. IMCC20628 TaxID=1620421 RepID=UPI00063AC0FB|nr:branched-chain amino acid ABC transporter permease [Hoeflea sp. IMCC20628]AKH98862.1 amino acid/amide ABC transporter membrane protein 2, HAAT family [Hoeflea sp. IMCC20628]